LIERFGFLDHWVPTTEKPDDGFGFEGDIDGRTNNALYQQDTSNTAVIDDFIGK
jgi:hypothetical protein